MAIRNRRPGGTWTTVQSWGSYGNVVANYASVLAQVQEEQANTELETKVLNYKDGNLTYEQLRTFLDGRLATVIPGTQKELDLRTLGSNLQTYETNKQIEIKRSKLEAQAAKGGISAQERLDIERQLLPLYKEGTPEYTEQLNTIAASQELAVQEQKNIKLAKIDTRLKSENTSAAESLELYKQARDLTDPGTAERASIDEKIAMAKKEKDREERYMDAELRKLELTEQFKDGGITPEEELEITRDLKKYYKPGEEEYSKLVNNEAAILGEIADAGKGGSDKAIRDQVDLLLAESEKRALDLETSFASGEITAEEYIQEKEAIMSQLDPEALKDYVSAKTYVDLNAEKQNIEQQKNLVASGTYSVLPGEKGNRIVAPESLYGNAQDLPVWNPQAIDPETGQVYKNANGEDGAFETAKVVSIVDQQSGIAKTYKVNQDGSLEEVTKLADNKYLGTGVKIAAPIGSKKLDPSLVKPAEAAPTPAITTSTPKPTVLGTSTSKKSSSSSSSKSSDKDKKKSSSSSSDKKSSSSSSSSIASIASNTAKKITSTISNYTSSKAYSNPSNPVVGKIGSTSVKKGVIPGTFDYGITEKLGIGDKLKKATSSVYNFFKKLF